MSEDRKNSISIEIFRNQSIDELTKKLADPSSKAGAGSAAAVSAALSAALLARVAAGIADGSDEKEKTDWYVRNTEILRSYMVNLVNEDVRCHGPLRRAMKEGDEYRVEAARQTAVSICLEIVNMMGKALEIAEGLLPWTDEESYAVLLEASDLAYGASLTAGRHVLWMSSLSSDDTYQYVMKRENDLTMQEQKAAYEKIRQHRPDDR